MAKRTNRQPRVLLDTCAFIALLKGEPAADKIRTLLDFIDDGRAQLVESTLLLAELYPHPRDDERQDRALRAIMEKLHSRAVILADVTTPVAGRAAEYRKSYGLKTADAVHLASAVLNECDWMVTLDAQFPSRVDGLRVFDLHRDTDPENLPWCVAQQPTLPGIGSNVVPLRREASNA